MRTNRVHTDQPLAAHTTVELGKEAARHLVTVLRLKPGQPVCLFNGQGGEYTGEIVTATPKSVRVHITEYTAENRQSPLRTLLGIGISRAERFEWVLQKATELGVTEIFPLYTERTEVRLKGDREDRKQSRWHQVLASACEQCGRNLLPLLHPPRSLKDWEPDAEVRLLLHHRATTSLQAMAHQQRPASVALLIGPEGGLSPSEIEAGTASGFQAIVLGPRVFRTETAPITALGIIQWLWGDLA